MSEGRRGKKRYSSLWYLVAVQLWKQRRESLLPQWGKRLVISIPLLFSFLLGDVQMSARKKESLSTMKSLCASVFRVLRVLPSGRREWSVVRYLFALCLSSNQTLFAWLRSIAVVVGQEK